MRILKMGQIISTAAVGASYVTADFLTRGTLGRTFRHFEEKRLRFKLRSGGVLLVVPKYTPNASACLNGRGGY